MNDKKVTVDTGDHRRILKRTVVKLAKPGASSSHLLLIQLSAESQALTFEKFSLAGHRELEDGSDRNATMIVALGKIRLRTLKNLGDESEWHAGFPHFDFVKQRPNDVAGARNVPH